MSRLDTFIAAALARAKSLPQRLPPPIPTKRRSLRAALAGRDAPSVIAEFKRRSPSQGLLATDADPRDHVVRAAKGGAAALSILTEPAFFGGSYEDLAAARTTATVPILAKDFLVDPRLVAEAAHHGADAVLFILRCLDHAQLEELTRTARDEGLEFIFECHDADEVARALSVNDAIVGVNNRNLETLEVDLRHALSLLPSVPADRCAIAESGYRTSDEVRALRGLANGVLIGTSLMRGVDLASLVTSGSTS